LKLVSEVATAVTEWEDKVAKVEKVCEEIPEMLKVAAFVEMMMPLEIKVMVFMTTERLKTMTD
jgi:hypothetical protein